MLKATRRKRARNPIIEGGTNHNHVHHRAIQAEYRHRQWRGHDDRRSLTLYDYPKSSIVLSPKEILLRLIQQNGEEDKVWASYRKAGWSRSSQEPTVCTWDGIVCDDSFPVESEKIISIDISNTDFVGTLISEIGQLQSLEHLDVSHNLFYGTIPNQILQLPQLVTINLQDNKFSGQIGSPSSNSDSNTLPSSSSSSSSSIFKSTSIQTINFASNRLNGRLPSYFFQNLVSLTTLELKKNDFTGSIPSEISKLSLLETISLSQNRFSGILSNSINFNNLIFLKYAYLDHNKFIGQLPTSLYNSQNGNGISKPALKELWLHGNDLSGTIPGTLSTLSTLTDLFIDGNKLTGTVPESICKLDVNQDFTNIPSFGNDNKDSNSNNNGTKTADVGGNFDNSTNYGNNSNTTVLPKAPNNENGDEENDDMYCDSVSCPINTIALDGVYPCTECTSIYGIVNPYIGRNGICNSHLNESQIISSFFLSMSSSKPSQSDKNEDYLEFDSFGENPNDDNLVVNKNIKSNACDYDGIVCNDDGHVTQILLSNKSIKQTTIPDEIGFLEYLEVLDLSNNELTGQIPSGLRFATNLRTLDLSNNQLRGLVPPLLCQQARLSMNGGNENNKDDDDNDGTCHHIACPMGTYNSKYGYGKTLHDCLRCPDDETSFLASKECIPKSLFDKITESDVETTSKIEQKTNLSWGIAIAAICVIASISIFIYLIYIRRKGCSRNKKFTDDDEYDNDEDDGYSEEDFENEEDTDDEEDGLNNRHTRGAASLPHAEEIKSTIRKLKSSQAANSIKHYITRGVDYVKSKAASIHEDDSTGSFGVDDQKIVPGEIDDDGWNYDFNQNGVEKESISKNNVKKPPIEKDSYADNAYDNSNEKAGLDCTVEKQKDQSSSVGVWEYPDPLEVPEEVEKSSEKVSKDSTEIDSLEVMLDNAAKEIDSDGGVDDDPEKVVWLDVPEIS